MTEILSELPYKYVISNKVKYVKKYFTNCYPVNAVVSRYIVFLTNILFVISVEDIEHLFFITLSPFHSGFTLKQT